MIGLMRGLGAAVLCWAIGIAPAAHADAAAGDVAAQLKALQGQLDEMRVEMGRLSGRLEKIESLLPPPRKPEKVTVDLGAAPRLGQSTAKIGMVEFSDYQCPYCRRFRVQTFPQLQKTYIDSGKLIFAVRNFPLDFHPKAMGAALVVSCARQQNIKAFWDVQDDLFTQQNRLGNDFYDELAKQYGLDQRKFTACRNDPKQKDAITADLNYARSLNVEGTPTFFIGRLEGDRLVDAVPVVGAQPYRVFAQVLDSLDKPTTGK